MCEGADNGNDRSLELQLINLIGKQKTQPDKNNQLMVYLPIHSLKPGSPDGKTNNTWCTLLST